MNKEELIELVKRNLTGGDAPAELKSRYHPKEIAKYIEMVYDDIFDLICKEGIKSGNFSQLDNYMLPYIFTVLYDSVREQRYIVLNPQPVPLQDNLSIKQVSPVKDQTRPFAFVDDTSASVWAELEADYISDVPGCSIEGNNIYFDDKFPKGLATVMVKQIVPFSNLNNKDSVFVPGGNNTAMFQKVIALMLGKPMPDVQGSNQNTKQA